MTTKSNVAAASLAFLCLAAFVPQPASAGGGGVSRVTVLRNVNFQPHRAAAFLNPGVRNALNSQPHTSHRVGAFTNPVVRNAVNPQPQVSHRIGAFTNPGVRQALNPQPQGPSRIGVFTNPGVRQALLGPSNGPGAGGVPPGGGAVPGGGGSGPSVAPQGGPGFGGGGGDLSNVIPSVGSDQPAVPASGPALQPIVAGPSTAVTPVTPPNPCSCLTKATLADGTVLFRDLCTNQAAVAPAAQNAAVR